MATLCKGVVMTNKRRQEAHYRNRSQVSQAQAFLLPRQVPMSKPSVSNVGVTELCVGHFVRCVSHLYSAKHRSSLGHWQVNFDEQLCFSDNHDGLNEPGNLKDLPTEIWQEIFSIALPPPSFLDPSLHRGPDSPWCQALRSKKALVLVCRAWWHASVDLLYNEIAIRRVGQIAALTRTLESPQNDLQNLVKTVAIICYIPENYIPYAESAIQRLLDLCPSICATRIYAPAHDLSYSPSGGSSSMAPSLRSFRAPIPHCITHLEYGDYQWSHLIKILSLCKTLKSLRFRFPYAAEPAEIQQLVILHQLEELECELRYDFGMLRAMAHLWSIPNLRRFTLVLQGTPKSDHENHDFEKFCSVHGHDLRYLHINPGPLVHSTRFPGIFRFQQILGACPKLIHLVYPDYSHLANSPIPLHHTTLMWIDVWACCDPVDGLDLWETLIKTMFSLCKSSLPSIKVIRMLDWCLAHMTHLPVQLPPDPDFDGHMHIQYPGLFLHVTKSIVAQHSSRYISEYRDVFDGADGGDGDSNLDSDWEPMGEETEHDDTSDFAPSSDEDSSSSSSSDEDLSNFPASCYDENGGPIAEIDHDAVLARFTESLRG